MTAWIETELKLLLPDEAAWRRVRTALGGGPVVVQRNHFFDRADEGLRAARIGVRLREEAGRTILTVKGDRNRAARGADPVRSARAEPAAVAARIELEADVPSSLLASAIAEGLDLGPFIARWRAERVGPGLDPELAGFLAGLERLAGGVRLERRGEFVNEREMLPLRLEDAEGGIELELALDRMQLPSGRVDYELEVELEIEHEGASVFVDRVERAVCAWLASLGGIEGRPAPSKLARLHAELARGAASAPRDV